MRKPLFWHHFVFTRTWLLKVLFKIAQNRMHKFRRVFNCAQKISVKKIEIFYEKNMVIDLIFDQFRSKISVFFQF